MENAAVHAMRGSVKWLNRTTSVFDYLAQLSPGELDGKNWPDQAD